jgi:hypothetical protein
MNWRQHNVRLCRLKAEAIETLREAVARVAQSGDVVFHRKGFRHDAASGAESIRAGQAAVSVFFAHSMCKFAKMIACRNEARARQRGWNQARPLVSGLRLGRAYAGDEVGEPAQGASEMEVRPRLRRRPPGRGEEPHQRAHIFPSKGGADLDPIDELGAKSDIPDGIRRGRTSSPPRARPRSRPLPSPR